MAQVDPANADAYLRRLIINVLRFPDAAESEADRNRRIDDLMAQMRAAGKLDDVEAALDQHARNSLGEDYRRSKEFMED